MYSFGKRLKVSLFGKSHADCVGCIIEGLPIGMQIDTDNIKEKMELRRPSDGIGTSRKEEDAVVFDSGVTDGRVSSNNVVMSIANSNTDSSSYSEFSKTPRPGHADLPALMRFKDFDISGGGQFSGRMTAPLVAAGAIAEQFLLTKGIKIAAYTRSIYDISDNSEHTFEEISNSKKFRTRSVSSELDSKMTECIMEASEEGDSVGGTVGCMTIGLPIGFGEMWFDALDVSLARAMFSIPGVKGVEFGKGFAICGMKGSASNDAYCIKDGKISASSNNMGGICGGMSNGMPLTFNVAFKPTPSISKTQMTVDIKNNTECELDVKGRHDPCIVPRAVPVVESMTAIVLIDQFLQYIDTDSCED